MSFVQEKRANVIELLGGAFRELAAIRKEILLYFAAFFAVSFLPFYQSTFGWVLIVLVTFAYFPAQYFLYRAMLRKAGMLQDGEWRVLQFIAMALLLFLPILFGFNVFWIPGLILVGKWVMAPTYLVARQRNVIEAIGDSWRASDGNTLYLTIAVTVMGVIWFFGFIPFVMLSELFGRAGPDFLTGILLWMHAMPVLLAGLSVSAYRLLSDETASLKDVFS